MFKSVNLLETMSAMAGHAAKRHAVRRRLRAIMKWL